MEGHIGIPPPPPPPPTGAVRTVYIVRNKGSMKSTCRKISSHPNYIHTYMCSLRQLSYICATLRQYKEYAHQLVMKRVPVNKPPANPLSTHRRHSWASSRRTRNGLNGRSILVLRRLGSFAGKERERERK